VVPPHELCWRCSYITWPWKFLMEVKSVPCRIFSAGLFLRMGPNGCSDHAHSFQWTNKLGWRQHVRADWKRKKTQRVQIEESNIYKMTMSSSAGSVFRTPPLSTNPSRWVSFGLGKIHWSLGMKTKIRNEKHLCIDMCGVFEFPL